MNMKMSEAEITEAMRLHRAWVFGEDHGQLADFKGVDLSGINFSSGLLIGAHLQQAIAKGCSFHKADMSYLDASGADFTGADLSYADLSKSTLTGAIFSDANLNGVIGNGKEIVSITTERWPVAYTATHMQIGWERHPIDDWWKLSDEEISKIGAKAVAWWGKWKKILQSAIENKPAIAA